MTPAAIISLVRDVIILIALGLLIWLLITYGKDVVKVADMKAVQKQIDKNTQLEAAWRKEQSDANLLRDRQLAQVNSRIDGQRAPVRLCNRPANPGPVPEAGPAAAGGAASAGGADGRSGGDSVDLRPQINAFERKYEKVVADCRAALAVH